MASFIIGKYVPFNSFLHRMDPRSKIASTIALMIALFIRFSSWTTTYIFLGLLFVITAILLYISKMSIKNIFASMKMLWFVIIILLIIYSLIPVNDPQLPLAFEIRSLQVYWDSILSALKIILRLFIMLGLTMVLTATTKPLELTYALEWFFSPLKVIKFPAAEVAMTISIALRFIPTLLDDTTRIIKAQESRGIDFKKGGLIKKITALTSLIVPLFISAFTRSEELANAMECRCYNPRAKRTKYRTLKWSICDTFALIFVNLLLAAFITFSILNINVLGLFGVSAI